MEHIAIMKKSLSFIPKILSGQKIIESRWYRAKYAPWDKIKAGEAIYFKNSGEPVIAKAAVDKVIQFQDLTTTRIKNIIKKYGKFIGINTAQMPIFYEMFKNKNIAYSFL